MKILFIHASAGAGHLKAAEALFNYVKNNTSHEAVFVDALDYTYPFFKKCYREIYRFLITNIPWIWGFCFAVLDIPALQPFIRGFRRIYNSINAKKLHQFLIDEKFDFIFSCHFMPTEITAALKRAGKIQSTVVTVVTDYDVHRIWTADGMDHYVVATEWTMAKLASMGVNILQISATGIPNDERFSNTRDIQSLKKKLGLKEDMFTVLIATGSFGIGPIEEIIDAVSGVQAIVVCGHNKKLFDRLSKKQSELVHVKGLVDNMYELMAVSDVMVTKPGGLSITEALVSQLPLIFFNAIPGQESNNIKVLNQYGIGAVGGNVPDLVKELDRLRSSKDAFLEALKKTQIIARPHATRDIISLIK